MSRGSRSRYWSNSKFARRIQKRFANATKPYALPLGEWSKWDKALKDAHPFVFWFTEEFLNWVQNVVNYPKDKLDDFRYWGYNRFVSKPHILNTKLKKGSYHEIDTRILHGLFETLVDYIEVEKAWMAVVWDEEAREKFQLPWYKRAPYWLRWKEWRCPEAGLAHLEWEMSLVLDYDWLPEEERADQPHYGEPTPQAEAAKTQYRLYDWWKNVRPNRPDPMDVSGWSKHCDMKRSLEDDALSILEDQTDEERQQTKYILDRLNEIEKQYDDEDTEMLHTLINIRQTLWT